MTARNLLAAVAGLVLGCASVQAAEDEKLLFGFEKEEVEKAVETIKKPKEFRALENGDFEFFLTRSTGAAHEREMISIRPMLCVKDKASQGAYSCKVLEVVDKLLAGYPTFRLPPYRTLMLHTAEPQANLRLPELLNTSGWYDWALPRDWSGYDLLRVDVCVETADQVGKLLLEVEDEHVEPPVSLTYDPPPAGKWVTLEMDLAQAVADRRLDLKAMNNVWVRVDLKNLEEATRRIDKLFKEKNTAELDRSRFLAYVDNLRLAKKGAPCAHPVLRGVRSAYTATLPRSYATDEHMLRDVYPPEPLKPPSPTTGPAGRKLSVNLGLRAVLTPAEPKMPQEAKAKADDAPVQLADPLTIPIRDMIVKGCLDNKPENVDIYNSVRLSCAAALDSRHIAVGFYIFSMGSLRAGPTANEALARWCTAAVRTADGGQTWKGMDGTDWPTVMGGNISKVPPRQVDLGGDVMGMAQFGCSGIGGNHIAYPTDRVFFVRSVFTGDDWWKSPKFFISGEPRFCHNIGSGDLVRVPSGRIWVVWGSLNRHSYGDLNGASSTYAYYSDDGGRSWCSWRGAGFEGSIPFLGGTQIRVVPYRGQIAVIGVKGWTRFDGKDWSAVDKAGAANLCDAVSCGQEIYVSDPTGPVKWYDGKAWQPFAAPGRTGKRGRIGVCGDKALLFVEPDQGGKTLLCWRKQPGAADWQGPQKLVSEPTEIASFAIQRYAPANFAPVAYMCLSPDSPKKEKGNYDIVHGFDQYPFKGTIHQPWIKLLKVPVADAGQP